MSKVLALLRTHLSATVLAVVALGLSFYVLVLDRGSLTTGEAEARKNLILPAWRVDDVTRVDVELATPEGLSQKYALSRGPKEDKERGWNLELEGAVIPAEEQVVFKLLSAFEYAKALRTVPPANVDRGAFGLTAPRARFTIAMGDLTFKVAVGALAQSQEGHYVEVEGRGVYVISKTAVKNLEVSSDDLRSKSFVPYLSTQLEGLWLEGEGGTRKFERAPWSGGRGSGFRFAEGSEGAKGLRVDGSRLNQVLVSFGHMQADVFLDKAVADAHGKARVTITMVPKDGAKGVLEVGGDCPGKPDLMLIVRRAPSYIAACVPKGIIAPLVRPALDFQDDGMIGATVDEITELSIERGDKTLDMGRFGAGFHVRKPTESQIGNDVGNHLLTDLVEARGELAPADTAMPGGEITKLKVVSQAGAAVNGKIPERVEEIEIGPEVDGRHLVVRKEDGAKLFIGSAAAASLRPSDLLLKDLTVLDEKPMNLVEMTVVYKGKTQTFTQNGPDVVLVEPKGDGLTADRAFTSTAISSFVKLEAIRWVSEAAEPAFGLDEPRVLVRAKITDADGRKQVMLDLKIGALTDDGAYATLSSEKGVFLVPRAFEEAFEKNFVGRESFGLDPSTADKIEVDVGDVRAELTRDGRQFRWAGHKDARTSELTKEIVKLLPIRAISTGAPAKEQGFEAPSVKITLTPRKSPTDAESPKALRIVIGASDAVDGIPIRYARRDDIDATFILSLANVKRLEDLVTAR